MGKYVSEKPAIGIRPIVDGREGPMQLRASLEPQVTAMANAAKKTVRREFKVFRRHARKSGYRKPFDRQSA